MVIILERNKKLTGLRWKLVSTYLLLVFLTILLINSFISESLRINYVNEKKISLLTQSNIIADRLLPYIYEINSKYVNEMVTDIVMRLSIELKSRVMVSDLNGKILIDSYNTFEGERLNEEELSLALLGKNVAKQHFLPKYGRVMYVAVPITNKGRILGAVFISSSLEEIFSNIKRTMEKFMILSFFSLAITAFISFVFADIISNPIEKLTEAVKKMAQGKFNQKVEVYGNDEISNLGRAFNLMTTKLEQVDKQRREFVANVSHELRTPLSSIKVLSESLIHQDDTPKEIYKEFLRDIDSEVDRLNKIIDNLLYLVDLEKENIHLDYQLTYVNYLIQKVISSLKPLADKKNIEISFVEKEKIQVMLDKFKVQQSLINVIGNAIKYTPENGKIHIEIYSEQNNFVIKVKDNGIGIPEDELPFIFDRFYRVDKARARKTGGTGLGLSITQQLIALQQGEIKVESEVNKGTTFYILLPLKAAV
ncbi:sensor histidine kinase [Paramaledivibacter caminithermalis]|uniref:histidine kinase n=1 Tax=Paramaledivibacter caminithermalis (strain DSM 15212 / CIP 107654 / DViRD3) TaxID=1121301 RepID=A0A1M6MGS8_PARC5|nr:ATP-binding protein [Paramaledivibacter caminithermalis]SHJ82691.1 HAMP domain-containing protein [Paramaledivibacter caminithermalis DSM 15212]